MKKTIFLIIDILARLFCAAQSFSFEPLHHNPWELIIYRPENGGDMNDVRCWLLMEDENGNDVTYSACKATYEWTSIPGVANKFKSKYFLSGGMAVHLNLKPGKYKISVFTPLDKQYPVSNYIEEKRIWTSNKFDYNTKNPAKVIFVVPTANENGFYNGGWHIDYKCPEWFKFAKPKM